MQLVFVGAGRLATQFAQALHAAGHDIRAVYSRTMQSARMLASLVNSEPTDRIEHLPLQADAYIIAVKDDAIAGLLPALAHGRVGQPFFHTAGSVPLSLLAASGIQHGGVIYPMQTFSKERLVDFSRVPLFVEGSDACALELARSLALSVSSNVHELSSDQRRRLHLAAVFACNFTNHCYTLSAQVLESCGLPFSVMQPLIEETAEKVRTMHPRDAQTGPAIRYDEQVIRAQSQLLADCPHLQEVYDLMSSSIHLVHS